jgi:hypothetical protein
MRTVTIPSQIIVENIQSYTYNAGNSVSVMVGVGEETENGFYFTVPQQFDFILILNKDEIVDPQTNQVLTPAITDFSDLMAQYPDGNFSANDLWPYIDLVRSRR